MSIKLIFDKTISISPDEASKRYETIIEHASYGKKRPVYGVWGGVQEYEYDGYSTSKEEWVHYEKSFYSLSDRSEPLVVECESLAEVIQVIQNWLDNQIEGFVGYSNGDRFVQDFLLSSKISKIKQMIANVNKVIEKGGQHIDMLKEIIDSFSERFVLGGYDYVLPFKSNFVSIEKMLRAPQQPINFSHKKGSPMPRSRVINWYTRRALLPGVNKEMLEEKFNEESQKDANLKLLNFDSEERLIQHALSKSSIYTRVIFHIKLRRNRDLSEILNEYACSGKQKHSAIFNKIIFNYALKNKNKYALKEILLACYKAKRNSLEKKYGKFMHGGNLQQVAIELFKSYYGARGSGFFHPNRSHHQACKGLVNQMSQANELKDDKLVDLMMDQLIGEANMTQGVNIKGSFVMSIAFMLFKVNDNPALCPTSTLSIYPL